MRVVFQPETSRVKAFYVAYGGMSSTTVMPPTVTNEIVGRSVYFTYGPVVWFVRVCVCENG